PAPRVGTGSNELEERPGEFARPSRGKGLSRIEKTAFDDDTDSGSGIGWQRNRGEAQRRISLPSPTCLLFVQHRDCERASQQAARRSANKRRRAATGVLRVDPEAVHAGGET